ncbi:MAG: ABC transporter ATP-binding protein [Chlorobiales bacterium]|nr:ABC transporter ATP-binding protein [Chlorobiales bacterium]
MNRELVALTDVSVVIGGTKILEGLSMSIGEGEFVGIVGPNGGGKTTLLRVILGLQKPTSGNVRVFGQDPVMSRKRIGYVPQHLIFDRDFPITAGETVLTGRLSRKGLFRRYGKEDRREAEKALETVGLAGLKKRQVGDLSGGELQRLLIARALAGQPELLLLDEPTSSIDPEMKTTIYDLLDDLVESMTIIMVTHDTGAISRNVSRIACLNCRVTMHEPEAVTNDMLSETYRYPVDIVKHQGHV